MSDPPHAAAPDEGVALFQVDCPTCGRDSDAPETSFLASPVAPLLDTAFLLCRLKCEACGTGFDRVLWPVEPTVLSGVPEIVEPKPEAAALLARYEALEASYRQEWDALYAVDPGHSFGTRGIDLSECSVAPRLDRPTAADPRLLVAARVARRCALEHPGRDPVGMLFAGAFKCCVSLDRDRGASEQLSLHLSISHLLGLGLPTSQRRASFSACTMRRTSLPASAAPRGPSGLSSITGCRGRLHRTQATDMRR